MTLQGLTIPGYWIDEEWVSTDDGDDSLFHLQCSLCTNDEVALCGVDLSDAELNESDFDQAPDACIVCADLDKTHDLYCKGKK